MARSDGNFRLTSAAAEKNTYKQRTTRHRLRVTKRVGSYHVIHLLRVAPIVLNRERFGLS